MRDSRSPESTVGVQIETGLWTCDCRPSTVDYRPRTAHARSRGACRLFRIAAFGSPSRVPISKSTRRPVSPHSAKRETQNRERGTTNPEPGTRNPEPGTRNPEPGTRNPEPRKMLLVRRAVIIAAIVLVYANSLSAPFIFDDDVSIVSNSAIRSLATAGSQLPNTPLARGGRSRRSHLR